MSRSRLVVRNLSTTLLAQLVSWALTFGVTMYLPRYLGDTGLGAITLASSFSALFSLVVALGTSTVVVQEIARDRSKVAELVYASVAMRLVFGLAVLCAGTGIAHLLHYSPAQTMLISIALGVMVVAQINDCLGAALRGLEEIPRQNLAMVLEKIVVSALTVLLVILRQPIWTFVAVGAVSLVVSIAISLSSLSPFLGKRTFNHVSTARQMIVAGVPFLTTTVFIAIYGQCDVILLSKLSTVAAIGWYGLAKRLGGATMMIPSALTATMLPTLTRVYQEDQQAFSSAVGRLFNLMLIGVVPLGAILIMAPGQIIALLHYPASFRHSIPVLMLMGAAIILWYLSMAAVTVMIASGRQASLSRISGVAALVCVPLCATLIWATQKYLANGAIGAMLADVLLEAYMMAAYIRAMPPGLINLQSFVVLLRATVAALPIIGMIHFVRNSKELLFVIPGIPIYLALCWILKCLHPRDIAVLQDTWRSRVGAK